MKTVREHLIRESDVEKYLKQRVKELGGKTRKVKWLDRRGAPDQLVMLPEIKSRGPAGTIPSERFLVEVKRPGGVVEPHQLREHKLLRSYGWRVEVVYDFHDVDKALR